MRSLAIFGKLHKKRAAIGRPYGFLRQFSEKEYGLPHQSADWFAMTTSILVRLAMIYV